MHLLGLQIRLKSLAKFAIDQNFLHLAFLRRKYALNGVTARSFVLGAALFSLQFQRRFGAQGKRLLFFFFFGCFLLGVLFELLFDVLECFFAAGDKSIPLDLTAQRKNSFYILGFVQILHDGRFIVQLVLAQY